MADVDERSSKVVKALKGALNDTRMFINFGELAKIKGYAPSNCLYELGENANILFRGSDDKIILEDTGHFNYDRALKVAK